MCSYADLEWTMLDEKVCLIFEGSSKNLQLNQKHFKRLINWRKRVVICVGRIIISL